jgi:hypothetical protein
VSVSPSQCVTVERCPRRWYFEKVVRLRVPDSKPQHFGHALHKLLACRMTNAALDPTWAADLTDREVEMAVGFVDLGLRRGIVRPREVIAEHDFHMPIGAEDMHGVIDVMDLLGVVEDHKTVSRAHWCKTAADLREDIPMMIYGGYLLQQQPALNEVTLRHNQFIQEDEEVRFAEVKVSRPEVRQFWARRVMPLLRIMDRTRGVEQWADVEGRDRKSDACTAYGGCPFATICHGGLPLEEFQGVGPEASGAPF